MAERPYSLADVANMTGLTQRTLQKHVASGALKGEKVGGKWLFSREEACRFLNRPEIRRLTAQRHRALAEDFLNARIKPAPSMLCVLDVPSAPETFLETLLAGCAGVEMTYSFDAGTGMTRVTLIGAPDAVGKALEGLGK